LVCRLLSKALNIDHLPSKGNPLKFIPTSKLTQDCFTVFGNVIDATNPKCKGFSVNEGRAKRFNFTKLFDHKIAMGDPDLSIYKVNPSTLPVEINLLECHPDSSQLFLPINCQNYLVVVAPSNSRGEPNLAKIKAFIAPPDVGISYHPGIWHLPMMVLEKTGTFAMLMWESGTKNDCIIHSLKAPIKILEFDHREELT